MYLPVQSKEQHSDPWWQTIQTQSNLGEK
ncbi:unnamed protein product [Gulo gulo]|uniref:Uncharacterized protein n=1 Tax=Gulo gulo TaxID=48420 RepID=A0A9X9LIR2_GULGU|nr:unnamed protein product [Gulo gulo]